MFNLLESMFRLGWTLSLTGLREFVNLIAPASTSMPNMAADVNLPFSPPNDTPLLNTSPLLPPAAIPVPQVSQVNRGTLNTSRFMVLGEGLAAGASDFTMNTDTQIWCFPAQMAARMGVEFPQRLIQPPGLGNFAGFASQPVRVPGVSQTTVIEQIPPKPVFNLSVPELRLQDALELRPELPLIHRHNAKQTAINLMWGLIPIAYGESSRLTQLEYAIAQSPTFAIIELGYYEALEASIHAQTNLLPEPEQFAAQYESLLSRLRSSGAEALVLNIPDPFDTAYFSPVEIAAKIAKVEPSFLLRRYGIEADDFITLNGLNEIGFQILGKSLQALGPGSLVSSGTAKQIGSRIAALNAILAELTQQNGARLYDLAGLFRRIAQGGYVLGTRTLTREYLGGFYSLNGYYPGQAGQAIIANEILGLLNSSHGANFPLIDLSAVVSGDPTAACRQATGPNWADSDLERLPFNPVPPPSKRPAGALESRTQHFSSENNWNQLAPTTRPSPAQLPLQLPPGLEQELQLNTAASYFGDGISALNVRNPQQAVFGSTGNFIFGGLAMVDSHLSGSIKLKFRPPVNNISHFEISFVDGFTGEDAVLAAPQFFKMPFRENRVDEVPGLVSSGDLNLETGEVANLTVYARYSSTALAALIGVNPDFPKAPGLPYPVIRFQNPSPSNCPPPTPEQQRIYASAWLEFEQRPDGKLDLTFYGSMFAPLGPANVWPLNFVGPSGQFATITAPGTVMHPHLQLSTKAPELSGEEFSQEIPFNTIQEFTLFTHSSAFGDAFTLNSPIVGGPAKGRSHLLGRLQIQFGPKTQNSVPLAVSAIPPGGIMAPMPQSPITQLFPARLSAGPQGFNEFLRFPLRTYPLDDLSIIGDPFDISVGALDLSTGRLLNSLLHRAFISQDLIFALLRVEPCTPTSSFFFRGPAAMVRGPHNQKAFRFQGIVHIPYPAGLKFPHPDFTTGFTVSEDSALDPFLWFHAIQNGDADGLVKEGAASHIRSSTGDEFSFSYLIPSDPTQITPVFEYENHSQQGHFRMHSLAWVDFSNSGTSYSLEEPHDTVTFSGFGVWQKDGTRSLQQVAAQICTSAEKPYIGIQIADGDVSNVNTKPADERIALP